MEKLTDQECEEAIKTFSAIADVDEAMAHSLLQDVDFNINAALEKFFNENNENNSGELTSDNTKQSTSTGTLDYSDDEVVEIVAVTQKRQTTSTLYDKPACKRSKTVEINEIVAQSSSLTIKHEDGFPLEITMVTWNIDGLDTGNLQKRFTAVLQIIGGVNPEIIFLQEVTNDILFPLKAVLEKMYEIVMPTAYTPYFCVSRNIKVLKKETINFSTSQMGRAMLAKWKDLNIKLINTHLESMKPHAETRKSQFQRSLRTLREFTTGKEAENTLAIFGGDLNIRDEEVSGVPKNVKDAWIAAGADEKNRFTWDGTKNSNINYGRSRLRFDRVYYAGPYNKLGFFFLYLYYALDFQMIGTQVIRGISRYPSDHFGIALTFKL